jgi:two-component sensor histidine kinase
LGRTPRILKSGHTSPEEYENLWETIGSGREWRGEFLNRRKDGSLYWETASISPIVESDGRVTHFVAVKQDNTIRKQQEEALRASLAEKEVLLREIHHRVKNNLQVVSSLLRLREDSIDDPSSKEVFSESQRQIHTISLMHEALYRSDNLARIDFAAYLDGVTREITSYYGRDDVRIIMDAEGVLIAIDKVIPCGLMVNELLTNAYKHAFPPGRGGSIRIGLRLDASGLAELAVEDDGVGLRPDFDPETQQTMGMRLVGSLAAQVGGRLRIEARKGTDAAWHSGFKVVFPPMAASEEGSR